MRKKDCWDKLKIFISIISSILIPILIAVYGSSINATLQKNEIAVRNVEISVKYIDIATDILSDKPTEDNIVLRYWAIEILKEYSPIVITPEIEQQMKENSIFKNYLTGDDDNFLTDDAGNRLQGN
ncbi:MAG: hypothetical protein P9M11_07605 [Candidatus Tenebribacter burtonii]|jgi:hypothetical protein|nr:hypothetical protein [Candidatus Tenebribacter burtonii]